MGYGSEEEGIWKESYGVPFIMYSSVRITQRMPVWVHLLSTHLSNTFKALDQAVGTTGDFKVKDSIFNPKVSIQ